MPNKGHPIRLLVSRWLGMYYCDTKFLDQTINPFQSKRGSSVCGVLGDYRDYKGGCVYLARMI